MPTRKKLIKRFVYFLIPFLILIFTSLTLIDSFKTMDVGISMVLVSTLFLIYLLFLLKK